MRGERAFGDVALEAAPAQLHGELGKIARLCIAFTARARRARVEVAVRIDERRVERMRTTSGAEVSPAHNDSTA